MLLRFQSKKIYYIHDQIQKKKEVVNDLRREKNIYDKIYNDLQVELVEKKDKLKRILLESKNAKQEIEEGKKRLDQFKIEAQMDK